MPIMLGSSAVEPRFLGSIEVVHSIELCSLSCHWTMELYDLLKSYLRSINTSKVLPNNALVG